MAHELYEDVPAAPVLRVTAADCRVGVSHHTTHLWCHTHECRATVCVTETRQALEGQREALEQQRLRLKAWEDSLDSQNAILESELEHLQRRVDDLSGMSALRAALVAHHRPQHESIEATLATVKAELAKVSAAGGEP
jgi:septal ring factor EnvC (AmiA/AmiB activator)